MLDFIFDRRSIRKYKPDKPVSEADMKNLLEAAFQAPSARNLRPCHYVVVTEREELNNLMKVHPDAGMLSTATAAIAVFSDTHISPDYWAVDGVIATENILIAAKALGLGTCWLGVYPRPERMDALQKYYAPPEHIKPISLIAIGHPDEVKPRPNRWDDKRIHREKW